MNKKNNIVENKRFVIFAIITVSILASILGLVVFADKTEGQSTMTRMTDTEGMSQLEEPIEEELIEETKIEGQSKTEGLSAMVLATNIDLDKGKVLIFGPDNKYIIKDHIDESTPEVAPEEWLNITDTYNASTIVSLLPNCEEFDYISDLTKVAYMYSTVPATIEAIKTQSGFANFIILENSDITINTNGTDITGIYAHNMKILKNAKLSITAKENAVKVNYIFYMLENAVLTAKTISTEEVPQTATVFVGEQFDAIGSTITIDSLGGPYGLRVGEFPELAPYENGYASFATSQVNVTTKTGRAISASSSMSVISSNISGIATEGSIGVHAAYIDASPGEFGIPSTIFGKAKKGFGVVAQSIDQADVEFPYGSFSLETATVIGEVEEGMGISTNSTSFNNSVVTGTAQKGIGISVCMLSVNNTIVTGTSYGATTEHFQVYDAIPDSGGISALSYSHFGPNTEVIGLAPKDVAGSIGVSAYLPDAEGNANNGGLTLSEAAKIKAMGDIGIRSVSISTNGNMVEPKIDIDVDARSIGIKTAYIISRHTNFNVTADSEDGTGILLETFGETYPNSISFDFEETTLNVTAGNIGVSLEASGDYLGGTYINNSIVDVKATSTNSEAGFLVNYYPEDSIYQDPTFYITGSSLKAESEKDGFVFNGVVLDVNATSNLEEPGITGIGGETGIRFMNPPEMPVINSGVNMGPNIYTIKGISKSVAPDKMGRKAAISIDGSPDNTISILENTRVIEEYKTKASKYISTDEKYMIYASGMNSADMGDGVWNDPNIWRHSEPRYNLDATAGQGLTSNDTGRDALIVGNMEPGFVTFDPSEELYYEIIMTSDINIMDVTFDANGGTPNPPSQKVGMGETITTPTEPTRSGHRLLGWTYPDIDTMWDFSSPMGNKPMNLVAKWERMEFVATFDATGGEPKTQQTSSLFDESVKPPAQEPTRRLFKFLGWYKDEGLTIPFDFATETMPKNDITIYAKWERTHYEVFFNSNGGNISNMPETMAVEIGQPVDVSNIQSGKPNAPTYEGNFLLGWTNQEGQIVTSNFNMPTNDVTLSANWVNAKDIISFSPGNSIVSYKDDITKEQVSQDINSKAEYTDYLGVTHTLDVTEEWNTNAISQGGVEKVSAYIIDSSGNKVYSNTNPYVFILNKPYIYGSSTALFQQFEPVPEGGVSWPVYAFQELPDFTTKTISRVPLKTRFVENGFTTQVFGNHYPYFIATGVDYFGNQIEEEHHVTAIVVAQDLQAVAEQQHLQEESSFWIEVGKTLHLSKNSENWYIDGKIYKEGASKNANLTNTNAFDRVVVAKPLTYLNMSAEPLQILKEQKNSRLVVDQGLIKWYFDSKDFRGQKYDPSGFYDLSINTNSSEELKSIGKNGSSMELHFGLNKYWQGKATLNIKVNEAFSSSAKKGNSLYLFYYNEVTKELEIIDKLKAADEGFYSVKLSGVFKDYIILDHLPGGKPITGAGSTGSSTSSTSGDDSKVYGISYRITDKTNLLSEELKKDIEKNLELIDKTIEQITISIPESIEETKDEKSTLPVIIGGSAVGVTGVSALAFLLLKKRKKEDEEINQEYINDSQNDTK